MSATTSPATGREYGVVRVCSAWDFPRSTYYSRPAPTDGAPEKPRPVQRRGPRPDISDADLLQAIRTDLAESPFQGEGHRKVWARLRILKGIRVNRRRVLRLMRENRLLSPHRSRVGAEVKHDGRITTDAPNVMWGADGARVFTLDDGWGWIFTAVEHFNAECVGWNVVKIGNNLAAWEPIAQGLTDHLGGVGPDVARGLAIRIDHGPQYTADHFINQAHYCGLALSYAFIEEPETNGVAERFNKTLKEQVIHGRVFRNLEEVKRAVSEFIPVYNSEWRLEKLRFLTPREARINSRAARLAA